MNQPPPRRQGHSISQAIRELRHALHRRPEVSGREQKTAAFIAAWLRSHARPDKIVTDLGGNGVAAVFDANAKPSAPSLLCRCELDALPIRERSGVPHTSELEGAMHACGHDGHMAMLASLALHLHANPPKSRVVLLFQPAEETGQGARAVVNDPRWPDLRCTTAIALHNLPGRPVGEISLRTGPMMCGSVGLRLELTGTTAHAAEPNNAESAGPEIARLITELHREDPAPTPVVFSTLTHASLGEPTFGVSPGAGVVHITCRAERETLLADEVARITMRSDNATITEHERFATTTNGPRAVDLIRQASRAMSLPVRDLETPMLWSEDFGVLIDDAEKQVPEHATDLTASGAMLMIGSGRSTPPLHDPTYDFNDDLLDPAHNPWPAIVNAALS